MSRQSGIRQVGAAFSATVAQLALAWVLSRGADVVPIPGTKRRKYLEENAKAADIRLSKMDIDALEAAMPIDQVVGERYAPAGMQAVNR